MDINKNNRKFELLVLTLRLSDLLLINLLFWTLIGMASLLWQKYLYLNILRYWIVFNLSWLLIATLFGLYQSNKQVDIVNILRSSYKTFFLHLVLFSAYTFVQYRNHVSTNIHLLGILYASLFLFITSTRFILTALSKQLAKVARLRRKCAIIGRNEMGFELSKFFRSNRDLYNFQGFLDDQFNANELTKNSNDLSNVYQSAIDNAESEGIEEVYLIGHEDQQDVVESLSQYANSHCIRLHVVDASNQMELSYLTQESAIEDKKIKINSLRKEPLSKLYNRYRKRLFDIGFSSMVIIFVLSWLYPILSIIIKLSSPGPTLFKQQRSGRDNKPFGCYKFRSMKVNKDSDSKQATKNDSRVTKIGAFMRKTSIDELPQFFNVFKGEMSIVGPRPHMLKHTEMYQQLIDQYLVRQFLKPGITGWAQVNGLRGETKELGQMKARVEHDIWYMENWSLMLDVKIIFLTVANVIKGEPEAY